MNKNALIVLCVLLLSSSICTGQATPPSLASADQPAASASSPTKPVLLSEAISKANKALAKMEEFNEQEFQGTSAFAGQFVAQFNVTVSQPLEDGRLRLDGTMTVDRNLQYRHDLAKAKIDSAQQAVNAAQASLDRAVQKYVKSWRKVKIKIRGVMQVRYSNGAPCPMRRKYITIDQYNQRGREIERSGQASVDAARNSLEALKDHLKERKTAAFIEARTVNLSVVVPADVAERFDVEKLRKTKPRLAVAVVGFDTAMDAEEVGGARRVSSMELVIASASQTIMAAGALPPAPDSALQQNNE